jgi:hypothetical protein
LKGGPHRSPSLDHLESKESQPPIRRNRKNNLQENRSAAAQFRQYHLLEKAQSRVSFNALEILHGRQISFVRLRRLLPLCHDDMSDRFLSRPQESEQDDKWSFCLTAGTLCPANQELYLRAYEGVSDARTSIGRYLDFYNGRRPHSSLDGITPDHAYFTPLPLRLAA